MMTACYFFPNLLSSVVFSVFIGTGHKIDLATSFSVIIFFDLIIEPMLSLPHIISSFFEFSVSMARIQEFLSQKEINVEKLINKEENNEYSIQIKNHCFSWGIKEKEEEKKESTNKKEDKKVSAEFQEPLIDEDIENKLAKS